MKRRDLLRGAGLGAGLGAAALAMPRVGRAQGAKVLKFVPYVDLAILDPMINTASQTRTYGYLVYDTLYSSDAGYAARPEMVDGHVIEDDHKLWTLTLRDGLRFHDGSPVLARDAVASIRRWGKADLQDYMIGYLNRQAGAATTVTFDAAAATDPCFSELTA